MMNQTKRKAIIALLPEHAFQANPLGDQINASWTSKHGSFKLMTQEWARDTNWDTRVTVENVATGELVTLRTEDVGRIREAIRLVGGHDE